MSISIILYVEKLFKIVNLFTNNVLADDFIKREKLC